MDDENMDRSRVISYWTNALVDAQVRQYDARNEIAAAAADESIARRHLINLGVNA
jgi:hypothetical protein